MSASLTARDPHPNRRIWRIAAPAIAANISGPLVGVVDTWALGHLPDPAYLAAIAVGAFIFHFVYWSFGFLRMGTTGLVAQAHGAGDEARLLRIVLRSVVLGLGFAGAVLVLQTPILHGLFALLNPEAMEAELALRYCLIRIWAAPAILLRVTVIGYLVGIQRTRLALLIELMLNLGNAALTVYLVNVLGFGMEGAAVASLAAEVVAAALAVFVAMRLLGGPALLLAAKDRAFWHLSAFAKLMSVNGFIFMRTLFLLLAFALLWRNSAALGSTVLSTNQVLIQFLMLTSFGLDGIAYAAEALVGMAVGRHDQAALRQMVRLTTLWALALAVLYSVIFWIAGEAIIRSFTDIAQIRALAMGFLHWLIVMPVIAVWSYQFDGIFIGATKTAAMMWTMILAFAVYAVALLVLVPRFGNHGLWGAMMIFLALRGLGLALCYPWLVRNRIGEAPGKIGP
ncbi:MATE family efflux transporter [Iodidimonas muriae]|uniref:MATE family efflux transporter n=1 Tax=Iodidimonas muriae TaxID=261467 RepID=UPI001669E3D2|nr:MATE family efflux transporter [Iodidimonas muriae]